MKMNMMQLSKFVTWSVLGDGCVSFATHNKNAHYSITRSPEHKDYIDMVASRFTGLQDCTVTISEYERRDNKKLVVNLRTSSHPIFTRVRARQYIAGHRVVDPHMLTMLDWDAAAMLYMDDGSLCFNTKGYPIVRLSTCAYSHAEHEALRKQFADRLGVIWNINRSSNTYQLCLAKSSYDTWFNGINKYILKSYQYKLPTSLQEVASRTDDDLV